MPAIPAIEGTTLGRDLPPHPENITAELQIRNKISLYALALDAKDYGLVGDIFTADAVVNYPGIGPLSGVPAVQAYVKTQLEGLVTQHTMSTIMVDFGPPGLQTIPRSTAYLIANFLGQGDLAGQVVVFYGKYTDLWAFEAGSWKCKNRTLTFLVSFLNPSFRPCVM